MPSMAMIWRLMYLPVTFKIPLVLYVEKTRNTIRGICQIKNGGRDGRGGDHLLGGSRTVANEATTSTSAA